MDWFYIIISIYYSFGIMYYFMLYFFNVNVKTNILDTINDTFEMNSLEEQLL